MYKIAFIGAGNIATNLAVTLKNHNFEILQIISKTKKSSKKLAEKVNCEFSDNLKDIKKEIEIIFVCVNDNSIQTIANTDFLKNKFLIHCAGSIDIDVFKEISQNYGVFYPLQTFTREKIIDFKQIPICIEANTVENQNILINIAKKISTNIQIINSEQRKYLHLSAVFANNFSNFLINSAIEILKDKKIEINLLKPLMNETIEKIFSNQTKAIQTGPAIRGDSFVINNHIKLLKDYPKLKKLYSFVSKSINEKLEIEIENEKEF